MLKGASPRVEVVCVGTELLTGKVNTHVSYIGQKLSQVGMRIAREHTVSDDEKLMEETFSESFRRSDIVICAGGLGPTFDDVTRDVWSRVLRRPLQENKRLIRDIETKFRSRGIAAMPSANRRQAFVLKGGDYLPNKNGTAPGQVIRLRGKSLFLLPGPGRELMPMFENSVMPRLEKFYRCAVIKTKTFLIVGVPESKIDEMIRPFVSKYAQFNNCKITHGILASQSIISVKFSVEGRVKTEVAATHRRLTEQMRSILGRLAFGEDNDTMESVIGRLLIKKKATLSTVESCTGGLISKLITDQPGASAYFLAGLTTYHNSSKTRQAGVKINTIQRYGAVSPQVAVEMATGVRVKSKSTHAISTTGIAGPDGGSSSKPVGLVYIGYVGPRRAITKEFHFVGDRAWIRHRAALMALDILRQELLR